MRSPDLRSDVQGLRAVAVAVVLLDHAFGWPSGGFLGVDVFFVISGFVVGRGLCAELRRTGTIDLVGFARRRVRRLAPSAVLVIGVTLLASAVALRGERLGSVAVDGLSGLLGVANWRFVLTRSGYFDLTGEPSPFRHLWSLGVEEQFYVLAPLLLLLLRRRGRASVVVGLVAIVCASITLAVVVLPDGPDVAFYSTATRAWQLAVGVLLAVLEPVLRRPRAGVATVCAAVGCGMIAVAVVSGTPSMGVPVPLGVLPTCGAALVVLGGRHRRNAVSRALSSDALTAVGRRSYSLYLWHWPVLVLLPTFLPWPPAVALAVAVVAACLSYELVERPLRRPPADRRTTQPDHGTVRPGHPVATVLSLALVTVLLTAAAVTRYQPLDVPAAAAADAPGTGASDGEERPDPVAAARTAAVEAGLALRRWPEGLTPSLDTVRGGGYLDGLAADPASAELLRCSDPRDLRPVDECTFGDGARTVMVVGDSTSEFLLPAFRRLAEQSGSEWKLVAAARYGCPFTTLDIAHGDTDCSPERKELPGRVAEVRPDVLVVVNVLGPLRDDRRALDERERAEGVEQQIDAVRSVIGSAVVMTPNIPAPTWDACATAVQGPSACNADLSRWLPSIAADSAAAGRHGDLYLDTRSVWCSANACPAVINGHPVTFDGTHATREAAADAAPALEHLLSERGVLPGSEGAAARTDEDGAESAPSAAPGAGPG
ncbi:acyltransferase family protein [Curtobacterium sp. MCBD17_023]|uniref:acyltransferase family protein n=1 Tax=Curtobacterium sp. MCBD17_023 TaxID=2175657 RepID=UPI000D9D400C|nr:acyltransferase family protein [Curtobacterium sp. MCBD17_023]PYY49489.1 hypothetical protein DEI84_07300 [Curtobacterium sp. MCBD17_023]